jgi:hypothetical protein
MPSTLYRVSDALVLTTGIAPVARLPLVCRSATQDLVSQELGTIATRT